MMEGAFDVSKELTETPEDRSPHGYRYWNTNRNTAHRRRLPFW